MLVKVDVIHNILKNLKANVIAHEMKLEGHNQNYF